MKTITILVGNIGTGKSTLTKEYVKQGYIIVCRDAFRYMIGAGEYIFNPEIERAIHTSVYKTVESFMRLGSDIVIDETNMSRRSRKLYIRLANRYGYKKIAHVMPTYSKEYCVQRRLSNNHGENTKEIWEMVWDRFNAASQEPTKEEGFDEIIYLNINPLGITATAGACSGQYNDR